MAAGQADERLLAQLRDRVGQRVTGWRPGARVLRVSPLTGGTSSLTFLVDLVRVPSLLGQEEPAQQLVESRLMDLDFAVRSVEPDPERLAERGNPAPGTLGIEAQPLTPALRSAVRAGRGVVVTWVDPEGPAAGALRTTDIIERCDGAST